MRPVLALLLACFLSLMTTADVVVCPDGCNDADASQTASQAPRVVCGICIGWSAAVVALPVPPPMARLDRELTVSSPPISPVLTTPEPPPRSA